MTSIFNMTNHGARNHGASKASRTQEPNEVFAKLLRNSGRIKGKRNKCLWIALYHALHDGGHLLVLDGHPVDLKTFYCEIQEFLSRNYSAFQDGPVGLKVMKETGQQALSNLRQADEKDEFQNSDDLLLVWSLFLNQTYAVSDRTVQVEFLRTQQELRSCVPKRNTVFIFNDSNVHFEGVVFERSTEVPVFTDQIDPGKDLSHLSQLNRDQEIARTLQLKAEEDQLQLQNDRALALTIREKQVAQIQQDYALALALAQQQ